MESSSNKQVVGSTVDAGPTRRYDLGIDVGAISTKVLLLQDGKHVIARMVLPTSMEPEKLAQNMLASLLTEHRIQRNAITHIVATGQGRRAITFADMARTEITAFSKGAYFLYPQVEVAVDIGGQGIRVMKLGEMGIISDFRTNDKCSSCTGCFLGAMATALNVDIDNIGELSLSSKHPETISTTCTIFAESEVVSLVAKGKNKEDIIAGLNGMVAKKIGRLINAIRSRGPVFVGGGVGLNAGMIRDLKNKIGRDVFVPKNAQFVGALGAALLAPRPMADEDYEYEEYDDEQDMGGKGSMLKRLRFWGGN